MFIYIDTNTQIHIHTHIYTIIYTYIWYKTADVPTAQLPVDR